MSDMRPVESCPLLSVNDEVEYTHLIPPSPIQKTLKIYEVVRGNCVEEIASEVGYQWEITHYS